MIKEYERELTESEKRIIRKQIDETKDLIPKSYKSVILQTIVIICFLVIVYFFPNTWLIILFSIIAFFIILSVSSDLKLIVTLPKFLEKKEELIETGIVKVNEILIDRYIKIANFEDEGDHFIIEYRGMLNLVGGQEFLGVRKLKKKIEQIEIMDKLKSGIYYEKEKKYGENITPFYIFNNGISDQLLESTIWEHLTNRVPFSGVLEDLNEFILADKNQT